MTGSSWYVVLAPQRVIDIYGPRLALRTTSIDLIQHSRIGRLDLIENSTLKPIKEVRSDKGHSNFPNPSQGERRQYALYWQDKLRSNLEIDFPDSLLDDFAAMTDDFSFAYMKEAL